MSSPMITESFLKWDPAQVSSYISSILPTDEQRSMSTTFLDNNIEGSLLPFITTEHLKELGIQKLHTRLLIKKAIGELITNHYVKNPPQSLNDPEYNLNNININNNYVSLESLTLSTVLIKDMIKKISLLNHQQLQVQSGENSPESPNSNLDLKKLNDNFVKLKTDLIPVIRLLKDSKPLPTPTLDPGPASNLDYLEAGNNNNDDSTLSASNIVSLRNLTRSNSVNSSSALTNTRSTSTTPSSGPNSANSVSNTTATTLTNSTGNTSIPSPTYSNRFSSGSILSMGTGKIIQQTIPKVSSHNDFKVVNLSNSGSNRNLHDLTNESNPNPLRPKLVETKSSTTLNSPATAPLKPPLKAQSSFINASNSNSSNSTTQSNSSTTTSSTVTTPTGTTHSSEPLKQLRASTEDSCLKILQQAMKRHHISRDDWSKYVLVICYGDKERILKLGEKPVVIFKELQELGKHPAIMLRQLASANEDSQGNPLYEDSRIGDDIPGGTL